MSSDNVKVAQDGYAAFSSGDIERLVTELMTPDIEWREPSQGDWPIPSASGAQNVAGQVFAKIPELWSEFSVTPEEWLDAGDTVVVLATMSGKSQAGGETSARFADVLRFKDGRMSAFENHTDTSAFVNALSG